MIKSLVNKLLVAPLDQEEVDFPGYLRSIDAGKWHNKLVFGISEQLRGFLTVDPVKDPGALFIGSMGSGKSIAGRFTVLTRMLSNSEHDLYLLIDPQKGMTDYKVFFTYTDSVVTALNDSAKVVPVIDFVFSEVEARKEAFSKIGAKDGYEYEEMIRKGVTINGKFVQDSNYKLARIFIVMEEAHAVIASDHVQYLQRNDQNNSTAGKLRMLQRIGRSYMICFILCTQRATADDVPSSLKVGLQTLLAFRVNSGSDAAAANLPSAQDIPASVKGRCVYGDNLSMQFPFIDNDTCEALLKKYYKPFVGKLLKYQVSDYRIAMEGEGNDGLVQVKPFTDIISNIKDFNPLAVFTRFLEYFEFKVTRNTNPAYEVSLIAERDDEKFAVLCSVDSSYDNQAIVQAFHEGAKMLGCSGLITMSVSKSSSSGYGFGKDSSKSNSDFKNNITLDGPGLTRIAKVLDNKHKFEDKEDQFELMLNKLPLARKVKTRAVSSKALNDIIDDTINEVEENA